MVPTAAASFSSGVPSRAKRAMRMKGSVSSNREKGIPTAATSRSRVFLDGTFFPCSYLEIRPLSTPEASESSF
jgi:hypothetical protein